MRRNIERCAGDRRDTPAEAEMGLTNAKRLLRVET